MANNSFSIDDAFFINNLFCQIEEKEKQDGIDSLDYNQKVVLGVCNTIGMIDNGGIEYFLRWKDATPIISDMFREIKAYEAATIIDDGFSLFPELKKAVTEKAITSAERDALITSNVDKVQYRLDELNHHFWDNSNLTRKKLLEFIINNNLKEL